MSNLDTLLSGKFMILPEKISFADYFNQVIQPANRTVKLGGSVVKVFPSPIYNQKRFNQFADNMSILTGLKDFTLLDFLLHFAIAVNETGGFSVSKEQGSPEYFFSKLQLHHGGWKLSYNKLAGNEPVGTTLVNMGILSASKDAEVINILNGDTLMSVYGPGNYRINAAIYNKIPAHIWQEACKWGDFNQFVGRGDNQLTGKENYKRFFSPVIGKDADKVSAQEIDTAFENPVIRAGVFNQFISQPLVKQAIEIAHKQRNYVAYGSATAAGTLASTIAGQWTAAKVNTLIDFLKDKKIVPLDESYHFPLKKGSKGSYVKNLQKQLITDLGNMAVGAWGADGDFGDGTLAAVQKKFKKSEVTLDMYKKYVKF